MEHPRDEQKLFAKHNWRGKLFHNDERLAKKVERKSKADDDVADFLKSATNKQQSRSNNEIRTPRIDTSAAPRWPNAAEVSQSPGSQHPEMRQPSTGYWPDPPKRRKGKDLNVKFSSAEPVIIGEGGDESDIPPKEISRQRARSQSPLPERGAIGHDTDQTLEVGNQPASELSQDKTAPSAADGEAFRPVSLRRVPTGFGDNQSSPEGGQYLSSAEFTEYDSPDSPRDDEALFSQSSPENPDPFTASVQAITGTDEGGALHMGPRLPSPPPPAYTTNDSILIATRFPLPSPIPTPVADPEPTLSYILRPAQSPQPSSHNPVPSFPGYSPSSLAPGGPRHAGQFMTSKPHQAAGVAIQPALEDPPKQIPISLRSAVHAVSDDALDDFSTRVEHYDSIFHLAAESSKPIMETTFGEWIRAGIWWFLKGRGELEMAIRSTPRSADGHSAHPRETAQPLQAYVDLAKAWWIIKHITPQHPEPRKFGNASMGAMVAIVRNIGEEELAQLIEMHQAMVANLRALTMSMKRNNLLPHHLDRSPLAPGLDTSIWVQYPFFTPDVQSLLSGNISRSMILERSSKSLGLSGIMPLSDTKRHFNYGRMFADVTLSSDDDQSQEFRFPCVISIMRDRADWQMEVAVASQTGLVNISILPDKRLGLVWSDVQWEVRSHVMRISLPRGFELYVQCSEKDFKMIWGMYDYTQKVEASLQPGPGEDLLFENTLKNFQYIDARPSKAFPPEPSKRCRLRLFECKITRSEGTGQRKLHRGYRLMVVTSPKVKTVSSVNHVLGKERPILFSYLRGEDGAPALLLKVPEESGTYTMVMTFHDNAERTELHTLLNGTAIASNECCSETIPLKGLSVERSSQSGRSSSSGYNALEAFEWQQLRVINEDSKISDHQHLPTVLSETLRICTECRYGAITDRVNLGQSAMIL